MAPELRHLRAFAEVARELSFTRAAANQRVGQSSVSKLVRQLEREMGVVLFTRTTHRVRLTAAGAALFARVDDPLRAIASAIDVARAVELGDAGVVRIGYDDCVGPVDQDDVVRALRSDGSQLAVVLRQAPSEQVGAMLGRHEIDAAIMRSPGPADVERAALRPSAMELAVPAGHPLASREEAWLSDLDQARLLVARPPGTACTDWLLDRLDEAGARVEPRRAWVVGGSASLRQLLEDDAVAIVPAGTVAPAGVRCVPLLDVAAPRWLLWAPGARPAAVRRVTQHLGQEAPPLATVTS